MRGNSLGGLAARVGVHLRVEHHDIDVLLRRQHVVKPPEADVVRPAVPADDPVAVAAEDVALVVQALQLGVLARLLAQQRYDLLAKLTAGSASGHAKPRRDGREVGVSEGNPHLIVERLALGKQHVDLILVAHHRVLAQQLAELVADRHSLVGQRVVHLHATTPDL